MNFKFNSLIRSYSIIFSAMLLSGCALPLPYQIASWALDGISYVATEKSVTDHGISIVAQKDCALLRVVQGNEICSNYDDNMTSAVAKTGNADTDDKLTVMVIESEKASTATVAEIETKSQLIEVHKPSSVQLQSEIAENTRLLILGARSWSDRLDADMYYVVGSFFNPDYAQSLINKHSDLGPAVLVSLLNGNKVFRVAVGPFESNQKKEVSLNIKKSGINNAWAMHIDHQKWKLSTSQESLNIGKPVALVPEVINPVTKIRPPQKQIINGEIAEISSTKDKFNM